MNRIMTTAVAMAVGAGAACASMGPADAAGGAGEPEGAVTFSAKNLGSCKVEFEIVNKTNITSYTIDWRIDDEAGRDIGIGFDIYRTGGIHANAAAPSYPDGGIAEGDNTADNRVLVSNRAPVTATYIRDLKNLPEGAWGGPVPNAGADTHKVAYRMVLGPPGNNGQTPDEKPEWLGDREWRDVMVTGCNSPAGGGSSSGSLDFGSLGS